MLAGGVTAVFCMWQPGSGVIPEAFMTYCYVTLANPLSNPRPPPTWKGSNPDDFATKIVGNCTSLIPYPFAREFWKLRSPCRVAYICMGIEVTLDPIW